MTADRRLSAGVLFTGSMVVGLLLWSGVMFRARRHLFGSSIFGRFAALGYLAGEPSIENARLLHDYVNWETRPQLRRRGEQVLRRMEHYLE